MTRFQLVSAFIPSNTLGNCLRRARIDFASARLRGSGKAVGLSPFVAFDFRKCGWVKAAMVVVAAWFALVASVPAATLVSSNSVWKYKKGTSEGSSPDATAWRQLAFDDSTWLTGPTTFYYGEPITGGTLF